MLTSTTGDRSYFYSRTDGTSTGKIKYTFGNGTNGEIGITNPYAFELPYYPYPRDEKNPNNYLIRNLKGYFRYLEVVLNREGESNGTLALYFDGAVNYFAPLPKPTDATSLKKVYELIKHNQEGNP